MLRDEKSTIDGRAMDEFVSYPLRSMNPRKAGSYREYPYTSAPMPGTRGPLDTSAHAIFVDSGDCLEIAQLSEHIPDSLAPRFSGCTINQVFVDDLAHKYRASIIESATRAESSAELPQAVVRFAYLCTQIGRDILIQPRWTSNWNLSLPLHTSLNSDPLSALRVVDIMRKSLTSFTAKLLFAPHSPQSLLVARDLQRKGCPVNLSGTFSARQVVVASLLSNVSLTNIFLSRLNRATGADSLGECVTLNAQDWLVSLRVNQRAPSQLIVASVRSSETLEALARCDIITAPCKVIREFVDSQVVANHQDRSEIRFGGDDEVRVDRRIALEQVRKLFCVEQELIEFLEDLKQRKEFQETHDGEKLYSWFDDAGFADVFYSPSSSEWVRIRESNLPNLNDSAFACVQLDTLLALHAFADFEKHQQQIDRQLGSS